MSAPGAPASERVVAAASSIFAVWTLSCHAVVWLGGSLRHAVLVFACAATALGALWLWLRRRGPAGADPPPDPPPPAPDRRSRAIQAGLLVAGLGGALAWRTELVVYWWWAVAVLGAAAFFFVLRERPCFEAPARGRGLEVGLWGLALGCVLITLVAHRIDLDDAFYVNLAVAAADALDAPLLAEDTLHGVAGLPIHLPVYRLHTYEAWNGALAALTGLPAIVCFHLVSAALAAALAPLALARLARRLTPRYWLWTVGATLLVLVAAGEVHRWYGNFAFVRMWQGKGIFLFVFLPLIQSYAIDLARQPHRGVWLRLAGAQLAAVGVTSSALWAAPAAALAAAACALRPTPEGLRRLLLVLLSSFYVLGAGWGTKQALEADRMAGWTAELTPEVERVRRERVELERHRPGSELEIAVGLVAGESHLRTAFLMALVAAWAFCPPGPARRYAVVVPLAVTLVLLDPYTTRWVTGNVTGASFWRALWILPIPLLLGLILTAPLGVVRARPWLRHAGAAGACLLFAVAVPTTSGLSRANAVDLAWPGLKVPEEEYRWARLLTERAGPGAVVVAPGEVCAWLSTFHDRVQPLIVRPPYLRRYVNELGAEDLQLRLLMTNYATGNAEHADAHVLFEAGLERFGVSAVLLRDSSFAPRARAILRGAGFRLDLKALDHEIWMRG